MSIPDRFYYFNELRQVGFRGGGLEIGGGPCFSMPVSPEEQKYQQKQQQEQEIQQATQEVAVENIERDENQLIVNGTMKMLDKYYTDRRVPVTDFIKVFSREVKKRNRIPWPSYVKELIREYEKVDDEKEKDVLLEKAQNAFNKGWDAWIERERSIEKKHRKAAKKADMSLADYRWRLQQEEAESPKAASELKKQIEEAKEAEEAARKARERAQIQAVVNRRMGRRR